MPNAYRDFCNTYVVSMLDIKDTMLYFLFNIDGQGVVKPPEFSFK